MNGRCETDPLDRAVDVCDNCYGEFCRTCLVVPRGRRNPVCTGCALALSGVRGHATAPVRGDRRTVKQRRADLRAAAAAPADDKVFRFFDADASAGPAADDKADRKRARRAARTAALRPPVTPPPTTPTGAPGPVRAEEPTTPTPEPGPHQPDNSPKAPTPAVARLEELRRRQEAGAPAPPGPEVAPDLGPLAEPVLEPEPIPGLDPGLDPSPTRAPVLPPAVVRQPPAPRPRPSRADPGPEPGERDGTSSPRPKRRRATDHGPEPRPEQPPTAPMVAEIRTIGGRRASDQAQPAPVDQIPDGTDDDNDLVSLQEALAGIQQFDVLQPAASRPSGAAVRTEPRRPSAPNPDPTPDPGAGPDDGSARRADTDANGNWIPPLLRGMAADAREASTNLPQRRRS